MKIRLEVAEQTAQALPANDTNNGEYPMHETKMDTESDKGMSGVKRE